MFIFREFFQDAPELAQILTLLQLAFSVWMMVDAYTRRVETFWYWVIFFFQPVGAWVYFFGVKLRLRLPATRRAHSGVHIRSLDELRSRVKRAPTVANRFDLAERLIEKGEYAEAIPLLEAVLTVESDYCAVLHALAWCRLSTNAAEQAVAPLQRVLQRDPRWSNYRAWHTLVAVHVARRERGEALTACRELAKRQPTLENRCLLAEHLLENGGAPEAAQLLETALEDYRYASWRARWHNWRWANQARRLLTQAQEREQAELEADVKQN